MELVGQCVKMLQYDFHARTPCLQGQVRLRLIRHEHRRGEAGGSVLDQHFCVTLPVHASVSRDHIFDDDYHLCLPASLVASVAT